MDLLKLKKPLALLFIIAMICAMCALAVSGQQDQQSPGDQQYSAGGGGTYALPGLPGVSISQGTNTVALSLSVASQQGTQTYFQVNSFAVLDPQSQSGTLYTLSQAVPGIMDSNDNQIQLDISKLQSSIQSTSQASLSDLYTTLRPSVNTLMVLAQVSQQSTQGSQATFQVQSLTVITPDGKATPFNLNNPMSVVVDSSSMRVYAVAFPQMYDFINAYVNNEENNQYTTVINNIVYQTVIVVSPPVLYPVLTPITFPSSWPIYYPVPVPVPIPVVTVRPRPPRPTGRPTSSPVVSPSLRPTGSPRPTGIISPRPTAIPSLVPTTSPRPTNPSAIPTTRPRPTGIISPRPTTGGGRLPTVNPTRTPIVSFSPPSGGGRAPIATVRPIATSRPPAGGVGGMPIVTRNPVTTNRPSSGGGGIGMPARPPSGGFRPTQAPTAARRLTELLTPGDLLMA